MKTLILTRSTGEGHNRVARALQQAFADRGHDCQAADALSIIQPSGPGAEFAGGRAGASSGADSEGTISPGRRGRGSSGVTPRKRRQYASDPPEDDPHSGKVKHAGADVASRLYGWSAFKVPWLFGAAYSLGDAYSRTRIPSPIYFQNRQFAAATHDYISEHGFDAVISVHLFPQETLSEIRAHYLSPVRYYGVLTDYSCSPFFAEARLDGYFVPHPDMMADCVRHGLSAAITYPLGIPVGTDFSAGGNRTGAGGGDRPGEDRGKRAGANRGDQVGAVSGDWPGVDRGSWAGAVGADQGVAGGGDWPGADRGDQVGGIGGDWPSAGGGDQAAARARLGLPLTKNVYLLMSGGVGSMYCVEVCDRLLADDPAAQVVILTGRRQDLFISISRRYDGDPRVAVVDFSERVADYMVAADILVTKPGAVTSTEAAVLGLPLVHTAAIPGGETKNARFFASHGMCLYDQHPGKAARLVEELLADRDKVRQMVAQQRATMLPDAAERIVAHIEREVR